jgi:DNA-directed RNA polymerase subunit delta
MKSNQNLKRVIVDYSKLNDDILNLLVIAYPDGYGDKNIISFKNQHNEIIDCVEVRTDDTIYLVKVSKRLVVAMKDFEMDDDLEIDEESADE